MEKRVKYRYPGINSFETNDTDIFFGRNDDRQKLADLTEIEKSVLMYARSGLGKSSLLKAALIPELQARGYQPYYIRLGLHQENNLSPVQNIIRRTVIAGLKQLPATFLQKFINRTNSLWYAFKSLQLNDPQSDPPIALIFDQFEEIASYPDRHVTELKQQLSELLYTPIPKDYLEALKDDDLLEAPLSETELDLLYKPLRIRVVFAIRSDQMSVLNELSDHLPNILKVFYELKPLSGNQALQAIVEPARREGEFITPAFGYRDDALNKILKALASGKDEIDTAQLQILLQYIEKDLVQKNGDGEISAEDLGDLNKVYKDYYRNSLQKLAAEQEQAQVLIEDKLIAGGRRVSYDMALCLQLVSPLTLEALIDTRLLRREPNTLGGYSYEISHDSLVASILETREQRKRREQEDERERQRLEEEKRQMEQYEVQLAEQQKKQRQQRVIITIVSVASIICLGFGIWAYSAFKQVEAQKIRTQENLKSFIRADAARKHAEIARKNIEKDQLLRDAAIYAISKDTSLEEEAKRKAAGLEKEIKALEKK